jgi:hypothetical protein
VAVELLKLDFQILRQMAVKAGMALLLHLPESLHFMLAVEEVCKAPAALRVLVVLEVEEMALVVMA